MQEELWDNVVLGVDTENFGEEAARELSPCRREFEDIHQRLRCVVLELSVVAPLLLVARRASVRDEDVVEWTLIHDGKASFGLQLAWRVPAWLVNFCFLDDPRTPTS